MAGELKGKGVTPQHCVPASMSKLCVYAAMAAGACRIASVFFFGVCEFL